jgi:hypothetical protein
MNMKESGGVLVRIRFRSRFRTASRRFQLMKLPRARVHAR